MSITSSLVSNEMMKALEVVGEIFQEENIKICVKESFKAGLITGISTLIGGILGGKNGILAGGLVGTIAACNMTENYASLLQIIHEMEYEKQKKMFDAIQKVVSTVDITDVVKFTLLLTTSQSIKSAVIHEAINFVRNELSLQISQS